jgi:replicative superfamily II helicase
MPHQAHQTHVIPEVLEKGKTKRQIEAVLVNKSTTSPRAPGIFSHHGNTPHGIRLAVEHAMRDDLVRFVVCTSTLAQGVNLIPRKIYLSDGKEGERPFVDNVAPTG